MNEPGLDIRAGLNVSWPAMATYTVSQVAARTGFSPSALRYYDELGLVKPAGRTASGYRVYDERSVDRLAFIGRAKRLGLTLGDITGLVTLWERDDCAPVQARLATLVAEKLADARRTIAELTDFADQLEELAHHLDVPAANGACSSSCACLTGTAPAGPVRLALGPKPAGGRTR